jgi:hypothetical protein
VVYLCPFLSKHSQVSLVSVPSFLFDGIIESNFTGSIASKTASTCSYLWHTADHFTEFVQRPDTYAST